MPIQKREIAVTAQDEHRPNSLAESEFLWCRRLLLLIQAAGCNLKMLRWRTRCTPRSRVTAHGRRQTFWSHQTQIRLDLQRSWELVHSGAEVIEGRGLGLRQRQKTRPYNLPRHVYALMEHEQKRTVGVLFYLVCVFLDLVYSCIYPVSRYNGDSLFVGRFI